VEAEDSYNMSSQYKPIESDEVHSLLGVWTSVNDGDYVSIAGRERGPS